MLLDCKQNKTTTIICAIAMEMDSLTGLEVGGGLLYLSSGFWGCNMSSHSSSYSCVTSAFIVMWPSLLYVWLPLLVRTLAILIMGLLYSSMTSSPLIATVIPHFQIRHMIKFQEGHHLGDVSQVHETSKLTSTSESHKISRK